MGTKRAQALKRVISLFIASCAVLNLVGCANRTNDDLTSAVNNMQNNEAIQLSVEGSRTDDKLCKIGWTELDQNASYKDLREKLDYIFGVVKFDTGSKNGYMYIDDSGNWTGNSTLLNAYKNKQFASDILDDSVVKSSIKELVNSTFNSDLSTDEALLVAENVYFDILPLKDTSGNSSDNGKKYYGALDTINNSLTRKEAISAIVRCDSPVVYLDNTEQLDSLVGKDDYNTYYALGMNNSYLRPEDLSLNYSSYNSPITYGEVIYALVTRYYKDEFDNTQVKSCNIAGYDALGDIWSDTGLSNVKYKKAYELEVALQRSGVLPDDIYRAIYIAINHGIISSADGWQYPIDLTGIINMTTKTYKSLYNGASYPINASSGKNKGNELIGDVSEPDKVEVGGLDSTKKPEDKPKEPVKKADELGDILVKYADQINMTDEEIAELKKNSEGFTFEWVDKTLKVDYCTYLNLRSGPSTDYPILRSVPAGTETHIIAKCTENGWYRVIANGTVAYQCGYYFSDIQ